MPHLGLRPLGLVLCVLLGIGLASPSTVPAGTPDKPAPQMPFPEPLTREAVRELMARLSDAEVRQLLLAQLDKATALPAAPPSGGMMGMAPMVGGMDAETHRLSDAFREMVITANRAPEAVSQAIGRLTEGRARDRVPRVFGLLAGMLLIGWGAERLFDLSVRHVRRRLEIGSAGTLTAQAVRLLLRLVLDLLGLIAFGLAALAVLLVYQGYDPTRQLILTALAATLLVRLVALAARLFLAPGAPACRLLPFDDAAARRLQAGVAGLAVVYVVGTMGLGLLHVWGLPTDVVALSATIVAVAFLGLFLGVVWCSRADVASLIRGPDPGSLLRRLLADLWPILMTAYVVLVFLLRVVEQLSGKSLGSSAGIGSLLVLTVLPLVDMALCRALAVVSETRVPESMDALPTGQSYEPVLRRGIHILVTVAGLLLIARLWGLDIFDLTARGMGARAPDALVSIAVTILVTYLVWQLARTAIDRRLEREGGSAAAREPSRLRTILPLVRGFFFVTICAMAAMIVLTSLGINIGPLLAGAGVVGIAIGFGAQTLVRDIVSGLFYLSDDSFRLGEYVDVGDVKGTVEKIGLRSMQLRHHRGALNTVPYGMIRRLVNESRDWTIVKLEFRLTYDTDIGKVKKILKQIGKDLQDDPELGPEILEPLKSQGVMSTEDSGLVVRAKFMAKPGDLLYVIRREAYDRILKAFAANGIRFAHRQVTVFVPPAAGAAAAVAADGDPGGAVTAS
jgi:small-conductance mechanosensitive channel